MKWARNGLSPLLPLSGSKDDGVRLILIEGETVETELGMEVGEALFK